MSIWQARSILAGGGYFLLHAGKPVLTPSGTLIGVTDKAGPRDEKRTPRMKQALLVDSTSSVTGAFVERLQTAYIESSSGVSVGGRTGLDGGGGRYFVPAGWCFSRRRWRAWCRLRGGGRAGFTSAC